MGSAMGSVSHASISSSDHFASQPECSPLLSCRKKPRLQPKPQPDSWIAEDVWISIMSLLDARSLLRLAVTNRQFCSLAKDDMIWKALWLRDVRIPLINLRPAYRWKNLYLAACDGSHAFSHQDFDKHIDWMRIGVFLFDSGAAVATDTLSEMRLALEKKTTFPADDVKTFAVSNVKKGLWIADLHLVRCPVCNLAACEGTMQALDIRHWELFLTTEYRTREWKFEQVSTHIVERHCSEAAACIFDASQLRSKATQGLLNFSTWAAPPGQWQPKGLTSYSGVAACTNLQSNQGLQVKFHTMKAGTGGPVVGIRLCQQLL